MAWLQSEGQPQSVQWVHELNPKSLVPIIFLVANFFIDKIKYFIKQKIRGDSPEKRSDLKLQRIELKSIEESRTLNLVQKAIRYKK